MFENQTNTNILLKLMFAVLFCLLVSLVILYKLSVVRPISWQNSVNPGLVGSFAKNAKLDNISLIASDQLIGPEDITFDKNGFLYTGLENGRIMRFLPSEPERIAQFANTQGRPLGMRFDQQGNLIVADAAKGLLQINPSGQIKALVSHFKGRQLLLVNHLDIANNGDIYFSETSARFDITSHMYDFIEASATGAVYRYTPATQQTELLVSNIFFSNGLALNHLDEFLLIAETGKSRILKYYIKGSKQGQTEIFIDSLPAMPDNIYFDEKGTFWIGLVAMRDWRLEYLSSFPVVRRIIGGLPLSLLVPKTGYGFLIGVNQNAEITHNFQTNSAFTHVTGAVRHQNKLYLSSLHGSEIAVFDYTIH